MYAQKHEHSKNKPKLYKFLVMEKFMITPHRDSKWEETLTLEIVLSGNMSVLFVSFIVCLVSFIAKLPR